MWREFLIYAIYGMIISILFAVVDNRTKALPKGKKMLIRISIWIVTIVVFAFVLTFIPKA